MNDSMALFIINLGPLIIRVMGKAGEKTADQIEAIKNRRK